MKCTFKVARVKLLFLLALLVPLSKASSPQDYYGNVVLTGGSTQASFPHSESCRHLTKRGLVHVFNSVYNTEWLPTTTPDLFGARKSKLMHMLQEGHHGVELDRASYNRVALWIDRNVPFYGDYEPAHATAQREGKTIPLEEILK